MGVIPGSFDPFERALDTTAPDLSAGRDGRDIGCFATKENAAYQQLSASYSYGSPSVLNSERRYAFQRRNVLEGNHVYQVCSCGGDGRDGPGGDDADDGLGPARRGRQYSGGQLRAELLKHLGQRRSPVRRVS
ncbi:MAG: hypothetical protein EON96_07710 [Caulobacteraceae bacterium]|nr:MAG: hypothetical protein EON96_07710 [Caulobacteraceae bacterium]